MPDPVFSSIPATPAAVRLVRAAMLVGLLLFGGLTLWLRLQGGREPSASLDSLRWVAYGLCAATFAAIFVLRGRRAAARPQQRAAWSIVASALAEGAGFLGAVFILLGGEIWPWVLGVSLFLLAWAWLPADPEAA